MSLEIEWCQCLVVPTNHIYLLWPFGYFCNSSTVYCSRKVVEKSTQKFLQRHIVIFFNQSKEIQLYIFESSPSFNFDLIFVLGKMLPRT